MDKKKNKKKRDNLLIRTAKGVGNWLNEESAAAREDGAAVRRLKKNPKYKVNR